MRNNYLKVGITDAGDAIVFHPIYPDLPGGAPPPTPLADLENRTYPGAVDVVGETVLAFLRLQHMNVFAGYPALALPPEDSPDQESIDIASRLAMRSLREHSGAYLATIERLMTPDPKRRRSNNPFMAMWPDMRAMILQLP